MQTKKDLTGYPSIDKPWLKYYSEEAINAPLPECTMYEYIYNQNKDNLKRVAMNYYGANITYDKMFEQISKMAGILEIEGIQEGEVVTICMGNAPDTVCLLFALNKIGAVANMVYGGSTPEELKKYVVDVKSTMVFTIDMFQDKFKAIADEVKLKKVIVTNLTESMSLMNRMGARLLKKMQPLPLPTDTRFCSWKQFFRNAHKGSHTCHDANAPAIITYTGGTTGGSKGAILSNKAVNAVAHQVFLRGDISRDDIWMQVLPLFIAYGATSSMMIALAVGMTQIIRIPMIESIAELCQKFKPNYIIYGPAYWEKFADDNADLELSGLKIPTSGGDMLRPAVEEKINKYLKQHGCHDPIMSGYGMTEVGAAVSTSFSPHAHRLGSVGVPFVKSIISVFDSETGKELQYGQEGEICIQTPSMMLGYVNNQEETDNIIRQHDDGKLWVHSGDLGYIDEDGFIFVSGRLKRFFLHIENGIHKKIFSLDIEKVFLQHPKVDNCVVIPKNDENTHQVPVAYVILKEEYRSETGIETKLQTYAEKHLTEDYRPIKYIFRDKFPLTKIGKVDYRALEKEVE